MKDGAFVDDRPRCSHGVVFPLENCTTCLRAERDALMDDARRYRWLASRRGLTLQTDGGKWKRIDGTVFRSSHHLVADGRQYEPGETLDEIVDRAMSLDLEGST